MKKATKKILIDAQHPEESRMVVLSEKGTLEDFEYEARQKKSLKGHIVLARVQRVEPSLQAAFLDFGQEKHGFLPFNEIHPDYYRIPVEDQKKLLKALAEENNPLDDLDVPPTDEESEEGGPTFNLLEEPSEEVIEAKGARLKQKNLRQYKIQEVIQRRQLMLVQVVKDERHSKGAALTTYLSLPGRYSVLMPNTPKGGGVSRKIIQASQRTRLKKILSELTIPEGMGLILRTAGIDCTKADIRKDMDYLLELWEAIRKKTVDSLAPQLIHEEGDLITKTLRDLYTRDTSEIVIQGEEAYRKARALMGKLIPSHVKKIKLYKETATPLFQAHRLEEKLAQIHNPTFTMPSGAYLVINTTEALTAIDVNSGKATKERHIAETALKTNLEAAKEIPRQLRLRDLGGLLVVDFIDMDNAKHRQQVERTFTEALKEDKARIQVGSISSFGLLEMSRQRLKPSLLETQSMPCPECHGTGMIESIESVCLKALRELEEKILTDKPKKVTLYMNAEMAFFLFNQKRSHLAHLEQNHSVELAFASDPLLSLPHYRFECDETTKKPSLSKENKKEKSATPDHALTKGEKEEASKPTQKTLKRDKSPRKPQTDQKAIQKDSPANNASDVQATSSVEKNASSPTSPSTDIVKKAAHSQKKTVPEKKSIGFLAKTRIQKKSQGQSFGNRKKTTSRLPLLKKLGKEKDNIPQAEKIDLATYKENKKIKKISDSKNLASTHPEAEKKTQAMNTTKKQSWWQRLLEN